MITVADIYDQLNKDYPFDQQEDWDNAGLLCGEPTREVTTCLVTLDVDEACMQKACEISAQLIVSHHPVLFRPISKILKGIPLYDAVRSGISIISAHTNFDVAPTGTNYVLCELLGFNAQKQENELFWLGQMEKTQSVLSLAQRISDKLCTPVSYVLPDREVRTIAVCTGAGGSEIARAASLGVDCYITGEMKYHEYLDARSMNIGVIAAGHFETEDPAMSVLCQRMSHYFPSVRWVKYTPEAPVKTILR